MTDSKDIKTGQSLPSWAQSFKGGRDTESNDCSCIKGTAGTGGEALDAVLSKRQERKASQIQTQTTGRSRRNRLLFCLISNSI